MEAVKTLQTISEPDAVKKKNPNIAVEVFLSLVKWFLIFVVVNNLIWAGVFLAHFHSINGSSSTVELLQDGHDNNQSVTNG